MKWKFKVVLHYAKERIPMGEEGDHPLFAYHDYGGGKLEGGIAFFRARDKKWVKIGDEVKTQTGETGWKVEDITDWVDYWAVIPQEFWRNEE